jgi:hypothetical protein
MTVTAFPVFGSVKDTHGRFDEGDAMFEDEFGRPGKGNDKGNV